MEKDFDIQKYMTQDVERIVADALSCRQGLLPYQFPWRGRTLSIFPVLRCKCQEYFPKRSPAFEAVWLVKG